MLIFCFYSKYWYLRIYVQRRLTTTTPLAQRQIPWRSSKNSRCVRKLVIQDRSLACLGISSSSINSRVHEHLAVQKICSRWIPHNLTIAQKKVRIDWCKEMLEKYDGGASKDVYNIESWICAYEPETMPQSTVWVFEDEPNPTKVVRGRSTSKRMAACFFGKTGKLAS